MGYGQKKCAAHGYVALFINRGSAAINSINRSGAPINCLFQFLAGEVVALAVAEDEQTAVFYYFMGYG